MAGILSDKLFGVISELIGGILMGMIVGFLEGIPTLKNLVFGIYKDEKMTWGTFYGEEISNVLAPLLYVTSSIAGVVIVVSIIVNGMRSGNVANNPGDRIEVIDYFKHLAIVILVLLNLSFVYDLLFEVNHALVKTFNAAYEQFDGKEDPALAKMEGYTKKEVPESKTDEILSDVLIFLVLSGLMLWANVYYTMRRVTLILLMGIGPIMLALWLFPKFRGVSGAWFRELTGSIFIQSIHALVFWVISGLGQAIYATNDSNEMAQLFTSVILWILFIAISESLRRLFMAGGDVQGRLATAAGVMGAGALMGMYNSVKAARESGMSKSSSTTDNKSKDSSFGTDETKKNLGANPGVDSGTNTMAEKMLKAGQIGSKAGKAVFGSAGAIAGAGLGPMGSMTGAAMGVKAGGAVGGLAARAGAAGALAVGERAKNGFKSGMAGVKEHSKDNNLESDEVIAMAQADMDVATWANENKDDVLAGLRKEYPDATPEEINNLYKQKESQKRGEFAEKALSKVKGGNFAKKFANGKELANKSTANMTKAWAAENEQGFNEDWNKNNPQLPDESNEAYGDRRMNAFNDKVGTMRGVFQKANKDALKEAGITKVGIVGRQAFKQASEGQLSKLQENGHISNTSNVGNAMEAAVDTAPSPAHDALSRIGSSHSIAHQMATAKTASQKANFITNSLENGMSPDQANQAWKDQSPGIYQDNYNQTMPTLQKGVMPVTKTEKLATIGKQVGAFAAGSVGGTYGNAGYREFTQQQSALRQQGVGLVSSITQAASKGVDAAEQAYANDNTPVQTAQKVINTSGIIGGVVAGQRGHDAAKKVAARYVNKQDAVQSQIASPSEVIQMAESYTDEKGERHIAPGAIQQVTTPNESYIQVRGLDGQTKVVSRKSAGHSGMRKGDVVYRDLDVQNDMLVPAASRGQSNSAYRVDSGGGKVPSDIQISSNPNALLGSPRISQKHQPMPKVNVPTLNQKVDNRSLYAEDLYNMGIKDVSVIVEKDRSYVQAMHQGNPVRVSPYYAGDTRLEQGQSKAIKGSINPKELGYNLHLDSTQKDYLSSAIEAPENMLPASMDFEMAKQRLNKERLAESTRRKSGLLG